MILGDASIRADVAKCFSVQDLWLKLGLIGEVSIEFRLILVILDGYLIFDGFL